MIKPDQTSQPGPSNYKIPRTRPQLLQDELLADGAPSDGAVKTGRLLEDEKKMWDHNAWDSVDWDDEQEAIALACVEKQASNPVEDDLRDLYNAEPASFWDAFYANNKERFFNDRAWLRTEFPELAEAVKAGAGPKRVVEIGCGPGNTLYPLLMASENPELQLHGLDYSKEAVALVKSNALYNADYVHAQVWDLSSKAGLPSSVEAGTVDVAICIFVVSALHPDEWAQAVINLWTMLKPGGVLLFRDYGRHDMTQLRFKGGRYMSPGCYIRGDKTRVYFFERDELVTMFGAAAGSTTTTAPTTTPLSLDTLSLADSPAPAPRFELLQLGVDRRLLLNRKLQLKMYRIWLQGRWLKPLTTSETPVDIL